MADKQTPFVNHLFEQVRESFFSSLLADIIDETIWTNEEPDNLYAELQVIDFIGQAIDEHLKSDDPRILLVFCLEDIHYFTEVLTSPLCVRDHLTAAHVVYHLLYDELHAYLEVEWSEYVEKKQRRGEEEINAR